MYENDAKAIPSSYVTSLTHTQLTITISANFKSTEEATLRWSDVRMWTD
jgi:hypothetical protein